jgi:3-oxoacyl-[acyl-carrier protein] reductase
MNASEHDSGQRELAGQTAVVTGASRGIGRAIAIELARAGAAVLVHARSRQEEADETARAIGALGVPCRVLLADIGDFHARQSLVDQAWSWRGDVDVWINNAGADVLTGAAARLPFQEKLDLLLRVDVTGTIVLCRTVGRRMLARGGVILNMGWDQAERGMAGDSGEMFAAAKGAIMAFSRSLAQSLAPHVRVNCLAPGWIRTAWGEQASDKWQERARAESLWQRWGTPDDVAKVARFLVSPAAGFINGQIINVNGGRRSDSNPF